jgi:hypothetical protein
VKEREYQIPGRQSGHVYQVEDLIEKPAVEKAPSHIAVMGRYIFVNASGAAHFAQRVCQLDFVARAFSDRLQRFKNGSFKAGTEIGLLREEMRPKLLAYLEEVLKRESEESVKLPRVNASGAAHFAQRVCQLDFVARAFSDRLQLLMSANMVLYRRGGRAVMCTRLRI